MAIQRELPRDSVGNICIETYMGKLLPKVDKLSQMLNCETMHDVHLGGPEIVVESFLDRTILLLG